MLLVRALYYSSAALDSREEVAAILDAARRNNPALGLTGVLVCDRGRFLQVLEGARPAVSAMLARLAGDKRHYNLALAELIEIPERSFPDFAMGFIDADSGFSPLRLTDFDAAPAEALHRQIEAYRETLTRAA